MSEHAEDVEIDALPYVDFQSPDYEAYALSLIEEEMKAMAPVVGFTAMALAATALDSVETTPSAKETLRIP